MYHAARPSSRRNLNVALERLVGKPNLVAKRAIMANAIVAQMLPDGSIKGGSAIKMRLSDGATRFTTDLDVARDRPWMTSPSSLPDLWPPAIRDATILGKAVVQRQVVDDHRPGSRLQRDQRHRRTRPRLTRRRQRHPGRSGVSAARPNSRHGTAPSNRPEAARRERARQHAGPRSHRFTAARGLPPWGRARRKAPACAL